MAHILVVDDDSMDRSLLRLALESEGHQVEEARDGVEGVALAHDGRPDLVITDIFMPNKDGLEVIRELRAAYPALKIITISGDSRLQGAPMLEISERLGADRAIEKSAGIEALLAAVRTLLAQGK